MRDQIEPKVELLRIAYAAFNARDVASALALMAPDVTWPRAFKGGFVRGHEAVRAYWQEQWSEIDPRVEPVEFRHDEDGAVVVDVHQVVRDLTGAILADEQVQHRFTFAEDLIQSMDVGSRPIA